MFVFWVVKLVDLIGMEDFESSEPDQVKSTQPFELQTINQSIN